MGAQKANLTEKQEDVNNRNRAIEQLERLLEHITHKYAKNERVRIKVTHEVAVQAVATLTDATSHADFLSTQGGISTEFAKPTIKNPNALLPGHIFQSGLQYRRVIDKL